MLNSFAKYLTRSITQNSGALDSRNGSNNETSESVPVLARLSQVEVEGNDWILIDPAVEGAAALEESWYVTPPPCFTRTTPVTVEISPLEDLLIEHPSMSVYRATTSPIELDVTLPTLDAPEEQDAKNDSFPPLISDVPASPEASLEPIPRRSTPVVRSIHRQATPSRIVLMFRSSQKTLEKRTTQALKRSHLDRSNKLREVFGTRGRQNRMRVHHSGANNNRKCY